MHAAQLRKKLGVMDPSREERYSKRIKKADDSSTPSPGICGRLMYGHGASIGTPTMLRQTADPTEMSEHQFADWHPCVSCRDQRLD